MIAIDYCYDPNEYMGAGMTGKYNARSVAQPEINASAHTMDEIKMYLGQASERVNGTPWAPEEMEFREVSIEAFWA